MATKFGLFATSARLSALIGAPARALHTVNHWNPPRTFGVEVQYRF